MSGSMKKALAFCFIAGIIFFMSGINWADLGNRSTEPLHQKPPATPMAHSHHAISAKDAQDAERETPVGVKERLGETLNLDLTFRDENDRELRLKDFLEKPTLILPVYFYCPQACSMMLASLASAINDVPLTPGENYQVLAISFDEQETPELAREAKKNYLKLIQKDFPEDQWKFLTGDRKAIHGLLHGLGYRLKKTGPHMFIHPNVMVVLSPAGKVIRYLYGIYFLPFDIGMALTEASKETPQLSIRRVLTYCFDYDPKKKTYVFKAFRIVAVTIILVLAVFLFFLLRKGKHMKAVTGSHDQGKTP
ncbi:MAG: SCO family protein [Desulfobacterales bacterium]